MNVILTAILFGAALFLVHARKECPSPEEIPKNCRCRTVPFGPVLMTCQKIDNVEDLKTALTTLKKYTFDNMQIDRVDLDYIPSDMFEGFQFDRLFFFDSTLVSFSDSDLAFRGLEKRMVTLYFMRTQMLGGWNWYELRDMEVLSSLSVVGSPLGFIAGDFEDIGHLGIHSLTFYNDSIAWIHETAFSKFEELETLILSLNLIPEVKRSMFPTKAEKFRSLDLSRNKLSKLPVDLFTNMPILDAVRLRDNLLYSLDKKTFEPIWPKLNKFEFEDNPIQCDCRIAWILKDCYRCGTAKCGTPQHMKGKLIRELSTNDLKC